MNKLLLSVLTLVLSGCVYPFVPHHGVSHGDVTVSMKNDVPCFSYADMDGIHRSRIYIRWVSITEAEQLKAIPRLITWDSELDNLRLLLPEQCIPYTGEEELKRDTLYSVFLSPYVEGGEAYINYGFGAFFCLSENKAGKIVLHQFKDDSFPATCPTSGAQ